MVTGGHTPGTAQLAATASTSADPGLAVEHHELTCLGVDRRDPQNPLGPARATAAGWAITSRRTDSGTVGVVQRDGADALQLLRFGARLGHGGQKPRGGLVDARRGRQLGVLGRRLPGEHRLECAAAGDLRGHRRSCRRTDQDLDTQQCPGCFGGLVGDTGQHTGLPGDARQSPARKYQCTFRRHGVRVCHRIRRRARGQSRLLVLAQRLPRSPRRENPDQSRSRCSWKNANTRR